MSAGKVSRSIISPTTQVFRNPSGVTSKSILKRPASLPLSPSSFPFSASFNIVLSPLKGSPHVHFPTSPSLTARFSTYSPGSYDSTANMAAPDILAFGDITSPRPGSFGQEVYASEPCMSNKPVTTLSAVALGKNVILAAPPNAKSAKTKSQARARAKFDHSLAKAKVIPRGSVTRRSAKQFPRSPSPFSPSQAVAEATTEPRSQRTASVSRSTVGRKLKANRPAALGITASQLSLAQNASPNRPGFLSPVAETPLNSGDLSLAFWRSVSVSEEIAAEVDAAQAETPIFAIPRFVFGTRDGALWSPGLPRKMDSLLSPLSRVTFAPMTSEKVMSPAPNDDVARYPSFGMVVSGLPVGFSYPSSVISN